MSTPFFYLKSFIFNVVNFLMMLFVNVVALAALEAFSVGPEGSEISLCVIPSVCRRYRLGVLCSCISPCIYFFVCLVCENQECKLRHEREIDGKPCYEISPE